jgi:hypothetical protein
VRKQFVLFRAGRIRGAHAFSTMRAGRSAATNRMDPQETKPNDRGKGKGLVRRSYPAGRDRLRNTESVKRNLRGEQGAGGPESEMMARDTVVVPDVAIRFGIANPNGRQSTGDVNSCGMMSFASTKSTA